VNSKWPKLMLMSGITSVWLLYEMRRRPKPRAGRWRSCNMGCSPARLIGLVGSLVMLASEK
jgi:hypothetical protein